MTRHKHELARLVTKTIRAPAAASRLLHVLLTTADDAGITWVSKAWILNAMGRYVPRTVELAAVWLRRRGLVSWERVAPFGRYPARNKAGELVRGQGMRTFSGGRIWTINLAALRDGSPLLSIVGTKAAGHDQKIVSRYDQKIASSDPSRSPSEILKMDPAPPGRERRTAASPPHDESETPGARSVAPRPPPQPATPAARPSAAKRASETPRAAGVHEASRHGPGSGNESARAVGVGAGPRAAPARTLDVLSGPEAAARMARELAAVLGPPSAGMGIRAAGKQVGSS